MLLFLVTSSKFNPCILPHPLQHSQFQRSPPSSGVYFLHHTQDGTVTVTSTLTITESRYDDRGRYSCSAYNTLTTISHTDTTESTLNINRKSILIRNEHLTRDTYIYKWKLTREKTSLILKRDLPTLSYSAKCSICGSTIAKFG